MVGFPIKQRAVPNTLFQVSLRLESLESGPSCEGRHLMRRITKWLGFAIGVAVLAVAAVAIFVVTDRAEMPSSNGNGYHLVKKVVLGGDGGWDYFTADPATHRIFIGRGTHLMVVDPDGNVVADIPGLH